MIFLNKRGFTIVELIAVIGVLSLLIIIAIPALGSTSKNVKQKIYDTKVKMIINGAVMYGQDHMAELLSAEGNQIEKTIAELIPAYIDKDEDAKENCQDDNTCVKDPRTSGVYLDQDEEIIIVIKMDSNRKVTAELKEEVLE